MTTKMSQVSAEVGRPKIEKYQLSGSGFNYPINAREDAIYTLTQYKIGKTTREQCASDCGQYSALRCVYPENWPLFSSTINRESVNVTAPGIIVVGSIGCQLAVLEFTNGVLAKVVENYQGSRELDLFGYANDVLARVAANYKSYILSGNPGSEDILIQALYAHGGKEMAEALLNSGNLVLYSAAQRWGAAHHLHIKTYKPKAGDNGIPVLQWGKGNS
jgi:hypothetical protein